MSFDSSRLVFIVGHYKSGSTWLLNMLSLHPEIRGIQETHIFHHLRHAPDLRACTRVLYTSVPWSGGGLWRYPGNHGLKHLGRFLAGRSSLALAARDRPITRLDLPLRQQLALHRRLASSSSAEQYCWRFFGFLFGHLQPRRYLLEKSPDHVRYIGDIVRVFPHAKLVAIHRDGRDVVISDRSFQRYYKHSPAWSLRKSILRWRDAIEAQSRARETADLHTLSYEGLMQNDRETLRALLDYLGLSADGDLLGDMIERSSFEFRSGRERGREAPSSFFRKGVIGDWRNHFGPQEKACFKELAGPCLIRSGYERDNEW
jgi:hypothetical protein